MAYQVTWTESAVDDLRQIVEFIKRDSPDAAANLAHRILEQIEAAAQLPRSNRLVPEKADPSIREAILNPYRIVYLVDDRWENLHVLRIWHAARGIPDLPC